jgi:hypothetical protein
MKRVQINRLIENLEYQINDFTDASPPFTIDTATLNEFKE